MSVAVVRRRLLLTEKLLPDLWVGQLQYLRWAARQMK